MSNQNAGYTVQRPELAFAANAGSLRSNVRFYLSRDELHSHHANQLEYAAYIIDRVIESISKKKGAGP